MAPNTTNGASSNQSTIEASQQGTNHVVPRPQQARPSVPARTSGQTRPCPAVPAITPTQASSRLSSAAAASKRKRKKNYTKDELIFWVGLIEEVLPIGGEEWEQVFERFDRVYPGRDLPSLKRKFADLYRVKMGTGNPNPREEVLMAKRAMKAIDERAELGTGEEHYDLLEGRFAGPSRDIVGLGEEEGADGDIQEAERPVAGAQRGVGMAAGSAGGAGGSQQSTLSPGFAAAVGARGRRPSRPANLKQDMLEMMQASMLLEMKQREKEVEQRRIEREQRNEEMRLEAQQRREDREDMKVAFQSFAMGLAAVFGAGKAPEQSIGRPKRRQKRDGGSWGEISLHQDSNSDLS